MRRTKLAASGGELLEAASAELDAFSQSHDDFDPDRLAVRAAIDRLQVAVNAALSLMPCEICGCLFQTIEDHLEETRSQVANASVEVHRCRFGDPELRESDADKVKAADRRFIEAVEHYKSVQGDYLGQRGIGALPTPR